MKKNRRNNTKKERTIMIASSVFVLSALTMTGIYMKSNNVQEQDNGYMIDFTALEDSVEDKYQEIAQNSQTENNVNTPQKDLADGIAKSTENLEDDLDYLPMEVGSGMVTIPGLTDGTSEDGPLEGEPGVPDSSKKDTSTSNGSSEAANGNGSTETSSDGGQEQSEENTRNDGSAENTETDGKALHFAETEGLLRPVSGEVLIPFSMDRSVYFSTLDQFKYNSALMIAAGQGSAVTACADGMVVDIFENEELGHCVTMDLGDGYRITYGQLEEIRVPLDSYVEAGETIAFVAAPTKYYSLEGSNLYLKLTMDGTPVNPEGLLR